MNLYHALVSTPAPSKWKNCDACEFVTAYWLKFVASPRGQ
jgi:hypothetical protein